jgi:hypothetical protein
VVKVNVEQGCTRCPRAPSERCIDVLEIIEPSSAEQVHQKVGACEALPVTLDEEVFPVVVTRNLRVTVMRNVRMDFVRYRRSNTTIFLLGGA